jgi:sec-independent protein translocase protein TatB
MFDIGFSEIVVIAVVALVVIGPERLPKTARTLGHLFGRLQRYVADVKADINREMQLEELKKLQQEVRSAASEIESSVNAVARNVETGVRDVQSELNAAASTQAAPEVDLRDGEGAAPPTPPAAAPPAPEMTELPRQASLPGLDRG